MTNASLNPDGLKAVENVLWDNHIDHEGLSIDYEEAATLAVSTYLAVAHPVVNSVEELNALPHETVIRDSEDFVFENIAHLGEDPEWWSTTDFLSNTEVTLPARILYRP